jgi:hypothetical protein
MTATAASATRIYHRGRVDSVNNRSGAVRLRDVDEGVVVGDVVQVTKSPPMISKQTCSTNTLLTCQFSPKMAVASFRHL